MEKCPYASCFVLMGEVFYIVYTSTNANSWIKIMTTVTLSPVKFTTKRPSFMKTSLLQIKQSHSITRTHKNQKDSFPSVIKAKSQIVVFLPAPQFVMEASRRKSWIKKGIWANRFIPYTILTFLTEHPKFIKDFTSGHQHRRQSYVQSE